MPDTSIEAKILELRQKFPSMAQGAAREASTDDLKRDATGYTHPNLHRRIQTPPHISINRKYTLAVHGVNSYRTTETITHDEESTTSEVP